MSTSCIILFTGRDVGIFAHKDSNRLAFGPAVALCFTLLRNPTSKDTKM